MSTYVDGRGSEPQRLLYSYLKELYPTQTIHYEFLIDELNQRIDIYLPYLGIAIEFDGIQHSEYTPFFHKDYSDFNLGKLLDRKKSDFLIERGIKLVRIPHNKMVKSSQELKDLIDQIIKLIFGKDILNASPSQQLKIRKAFILLFVLKIKQPFRKQSSYFEKKIQLGQ